MSRAHPHTAAALAVARAAHHGTPEQLAAARRNLAEVKLRTAISEALSADPPLLPEQRAALADFIADGAR